MNSSGTRGDSWAPPMVTDPVPMATGMSPNAANAPVESDAVSMPSPASPTGGRSIEADRAK